VENGGGKRRQPWNNPQIILTIKYTVTINLAVVFYATSDGHKFTHVHFDFWHLNLVCGLSIFAVNTVTQPKLVRMRSRWLAYCPNTRIRIIPIQQPEPSGSEAGEYHGWETEVGNFCRQASHSCCVGFFYMP
jgi:hypothetical protein